MARQYVIADPAKPEFAKIKESKSIEYREELKARLEFAADNPDCGGHFEDGIPEEYRRFNHHEYAIWYTLENGQVKIIHIDFNRSDPRSLRFRLIRSIKC